MSQVTLDVLRGIAQAAANSYDGAHDENGNPIEIGLKREQGHPVHDSRHLDGFQVRVDGNNLIVTYQHDLKLKDIYGSKLEDELEQTMSDITSHLKKEYKKITGNTLSLSPADEVNAHVQKISNVRATCTASKIYKIGELEDVVDKQEPSKSKLEKNFKDFLDQGGWGSKPGNKDQQGQHKS
jgi:hypothetical protein|tara:strand:+ start:467 stop:1012 length:546 start_codon:yes stop_codon:yes gene_type:complete